MLIIIIIIIIMMMIYYYYIKHQVILNYREELHALLRWEYQCIALANLSSLFCDYGAISVEMF